MKSKIMKRAHEIRKNSAKKFNCKTSDIIFSLCLKQSWKESKSMTNESKELMKSSNIIVKKNVKNNNVVDIQIISDDFQYTLKLIKKIPGRKFDNDRKIWTIPTEDWEYQTSGWLSY